MPCVVSLQEREAQIQGGSAGRRTMQGREEIRRGKESPEDTALVPQETPEHKKCVTEVVQPRYKGHHQSGAQDAQSGRSGEPTSQASPGQVAPGR